MTKPSTVFAALALALTAALAARLVQMAAQSNTQVHRINTTDTRRL